MFRFYFSITLWLVCVGYGHCDDQAEAEVLLRQCLAERCRLTSGVSRISGTVFRETDKGVKINGKVTTLYAFDRINDLWRYDNTEPVAVAEINDTKHFIESNDNVHARVNADAELRWFRSRDRVVEWFKLGPSSRNSIYVRDRLAGSQVSDIHHQFDIRAAGLLLYPAFESGQTLEQLVESLCKFDVLGIVEENREGHTETVLSLRDSKLEISIELRLRQQEGFTPVFLKMTDKNWPDDPYICKASWIETSGVYVPVLLQVGRSFPPIELREEYRLDLKWESVNSGVPESYFEIDSLTGIPVGTPILDGKTGKQLARFGVVGRPNGAPPSKKSSRLSLAIGVLLTLAAAVIAWKVRRSRASVIPQP